MLLDHLVHLVGGKVFAKPGVQLVIAGHQRLQWRNPFLHVAEHGFRRIESWFLLQEADRYAAGGIGFSKERLILTGHDAQQGALAGAVQAEYANLGTRQKREPDVVEHTDVGRMHLPETLHGVDELGHGSKIRNARLGIRRNPGCGRRVPDL
jgi:hypothetical protein